MFKQEISFIKNIFKKDEIQLHEPCFMGKEKQYLNECIDSGFVSSVGKFVNLFEDKIKEFFKVKYAIAMNCGTSALHMALLANKIGKNHEVITQSISFVATANAISYSGAKIIFLDSSLDTLSLDPLALKTFFKKNTYQKNNKCFNKITKKQIKALVVMHTFGLSAYIDEILDICNENNIILIEDSAEALGSFYNNQALGTFGECGILSFNGNKIITGGCGGVLITNNEKIAKFARHLSTTAKINHPYEYEHDFIGYNYRLCNVNAAILLAQFENLELFLQKKRELAFKYKDFFENNQNFKFIEEIENSKSNFWLNALICKNEKIRNEFLNTCFKNKIYTRAIWKSLANLNMYKKCQNDGLKNTKKLEKLIINLPSSVVL